MPEGTDADRLRERGIWLAEICKAEGFRFSPRLHVDLWGNRRGVYRYRDRRNVLRFFREPVGFRMNDIS